MLASFYSCNFIQNNRISFGHSFVLLYENLRGASWSGGGYGLYCRLSVSLPITSNSGYIAILLCCCQPVGRYVHRHFPFTLFEEVTRIKRLILGIKIEHTNIQVKFGLWYDWAVFDSVMPLGPRLNSNNFQFPFILFFSDVHKFHIYVPSHCP